MVCSFQCMQAQQGFSILYEQYSLGINNTDTRPRSNRLIVTDSLSFWYNIPENGKDPMKKDTLFGVKDLHHAVLFNNKSRVYYSEVTFPEDQPKYLITDTLESSGWVYFDQYKEILGTRCRAALRVNKQNDSTLAWFAESIPNSFGPFYYMGLPGLVLEVYDQARFRHLKAIEIKKGGFQVIMPRGFILVSPDEFANRRQ